MVPQGFRVTDRPSASTAGARRLPSRLGYVILAEEPCDDSPTENHEQADQERYGTGT